MDKKIGVRAGLNILIAVFLLALTGEYGGERLTLIETLEKQSYDWRLQRAPVQKRDDIVIIDIDRDTLRQYGAWPFERGKFADLNRRLADDYRARIVAYALPFSRPDNEALALLDAIEEEIKSKGSGGDAAGAPRRQTSRGPGGGPGRSPGGTGQARQIAQSQIMLNQTVRDLREYYDFDSQMLRSFGDNRAVLGFVFDETGRVEGALPPPVRFTDSRKKAIPKTAVRLLTEGWEYYSGYAGNLQSYLTAVDNAAGHINFNVDKDGVLRRAPHFILHAGGHYPSLPIAVYRRLLETNKEFIADIPDGDSIESVSVGSRTIPLNDSSNMYIRYLGTGGRNVNFETTPAAVFRYLSFADVAEGAVPREYLDDKIVLVGSSSEQLRHLFATPVNPAMPGVEILASQLANILDKNILHRDDSIAAEELLTLVGLSALLSLLFAVLSPVLGVLILLASIAGYMYLALHQWDINYAIWTMVPALITLTGLFIFNTIVGFFFAWRANRHLQSTFGQYVPPEFAKKIGAGGAAINLEGEERELSVLFSDVRNFTAISEELTPRELTLLMNRMFTTLTEAIHKHGGTVDKYIGDAIMAFWNAPLDVDNHAAKSVLAAIDMQTAMRQLSDDLVAQGFKEMHLGVGIATGTANVGNMGSNLRMTYTAIGDTVNLASRTEGLTKFYHSPILVTETTKAQCGDGMGFRAVDMVRVKGREQPVTLYAPLGEAQLLTPEQLAHLELFEKMRGLYVSGDFAAAEKALQEYRAAAPDDPLSEIYRERLALLLKNPPQRWDGVITHETK